MWFQSWRPQTKDSGGAPREGTGWRGILGRLGMGPTWGHPGSFLGASSSILDNPQLGFWVPPEGFMGSKSVQNLSLMRNLLLDYVGYNVNRSIWGSPRLPPPS